MTKKFVTIFAFILLATVWPWAMGLTVPVQDTPERLLGKAERSFSRGSYDSALTFYGQAARQFEIQKVWKGYVKALAGKASVLIRFREYERATVILDSALGVKKLLPENCEEIATACYVYGVLYDLTNKPTESLAMHRDALSIRVALFGPRHFRVSESYNGIGEVYRYTLRDYGEAEKNFKQSVGILEQLPDADRKYLYRGYYNLATTNRLKNDFEKALGYAFKAIQSQEEDTASLIKCYGMIANIYNDDDALEKALPYYRKALTLQLARKELSAGMANDYKNLSAAYIETGETSLALQCVDSALMILMKNASYDSAGLANVYLIRGKALREAGRYREAAQSYHRSLLIQRRYSKRNALDISNINMHLSSTMDKSGQYDSALYYVQQCIRTALGDEVKLTGWENPSYEALAGQPHLYSELAHKGTVLMKLKEGDDASRLKLALECFNLSDRLMDIYWDSQDRENSKLQFVSSNYYIYEQALNSIFDLYRLTSDAAYIQRTFQLMDKSKARILRQRVEEARSLARRNIPDSLLSHERDLVTRIAALQNQLGSLKKDASSDTVEKALNTEMMTREQELATWREKIRSRFPQYAFEPKVPGAMNLADLKTKLDDKALLVEYFFGDKTIYAFVLSSGVQHVVKIVNKNISDSIYRFCRLLSGGLKSRNLEADFKNYTRLSFNLYNDLLAPVLKVSGIDIQKAPRQILIIPDGALGLLPFQALTVSLYAGGRGVDYRALDYLVRHCTISYSYDAASLFADDYGAEWGKNLLAFGWSDGTKEIVKDASSLPGTYRELQSIREIMPGKFVMGKEASKRSFVEQAPGYNILHLAIHGEADENDLYNNYLQFQDEKLFAHELYGFNLHTNLTVLSACETGYGKVYNAEGIYSIARGFFYAGSKSLLMTLWRIDDQSTASLIRGFYKNLEDEEYASEALSRSQRDYLEAADQYSAHPAYWAGLVVWGAHNRVTSRSVYGSLYVVLPVVVILLGVGYFLVRRRKRKQMYRELRGATP